MKKAAALILALALVLYFALRNGGDGEREQERQQGGSTPRRTIDFAELARESLELAPVGEAPFEVRFIEKKFAVVPPAAKLALAMKKGDKARTVFSEDCTLGTDERFGAAGGAVAGNGANGFTLTAPKEGGDYALTISSKTGAFDDYRVLLIVAYKAAMTRQRDKKSWDASVGGARLGTYLDPVFAPIKPSWRVYVHRVKYPPPSWFVKITPANKDCRLSPYLRIEAMVALPQRDVTKPDKARVRHTDYFALDYHFIDKLTALGDRLTKDKGVTLTEFRPTSVFRTPAHNKRIGGANYSRHMYGDAADILVDEDDDGRMDDLNKDGKINRKDGRIIAEALRELERAGTVKIGGIGLYESPPGINTVGSYVHLDARGYTMRWGYYYPRGKKMGLWWWPKTEFPYTSTPPKHLLEWERRGRKEK